MSLKEKIQQDTKEAMRQKDALRVSVLRMLSAAISNKEKEKRAVLSKTEPAEKLEELSKLTDEEVTQVIVSETKKRRDSIEQYEKGGRADLVEKEKQELDILSAYLPEQMGEDEIRKIVKQKIDELNISGPQETGKLMAALMPQLKGKADGKLVNKIVQEELKP